MRRRLALAIAGVASVAVVVFAVPLALVIAHADRDSELLRLGRDTAAATRQIDLGSAPGADPIELPAIAQTSRRLMRPPAGSRRRAAS